MALKPESLKLRHEYNVILILQSLSKIEDINNKK